MPPSLARRLLKKLPPKPTPWPLKKKPPPKKLRLKKLLRLLTLLLRLLTLLLRLLTLLLLRLLPRLSKPLGLPPRRLSPGNGNTKTGSTFRLLPVFCWRPALAPESARSARSAKHQGQSEPDEKQRRNHHETSVVHTLSSGQMPRRAAIRNSTLPCGPVIGLVVMP